jgi:hypothetical protein
LTDPALRLLPLLLLQAVTPCCCRVHVQLLLLLLLCPADVATVAAGLLLHSCQLHPQALLLLGYRRV